MTFRDMRLKAGYPTQQSLAAASGVEQTSISQIELGKTFSPRFITVQRLAKALRTTPERVARAIQKSEAA